ncbi:Transcriptional regulator containing a DNA-binding HTH domain and an aminotransferase domain [Xenorhabdus poinarii G6]|uniref:Transcriptional regulator containing a DNA-binding HTH domain and an aminotransferase domain n=1 Tax=Xenorhabdus poinarii G6 TaxID=1354304 RepID=A0A068R2Z9_9GAMM|nr:PLP-dependent aminotransferase family protein [Xenorhabdus poinarii]CDG21409.1 Transcriptional regulator containing a DNA-binding HTH domain and an aminotransferase domain [Xenorhabdus poinarii G6]
MFTYEIIADEVATAITNGQLQPGTRIRSIRAYANSRNISINTVKTAYRLLEDRGLIVARPQSGYFVNHTLPELLEQQHAHTFREKLPLTGINRLFSTILEYQAKEGYLDLALACPTGDRFYPANRLRKLTSQLIRSTKTSLTSYTLPPGSFRLRSQIARRGLHLGMVLSADDILITHGTMEALSLAVRATTRPGDRIAVETPTFYNLYPMLEDLGRRIIEIKTHPHTGMCLDTLQKLIDKGEISAVMTIPSGHNPLGFTMPEENRRRLAKMANRYQIPVIEDAMYAELQYSERPVFNIKAFDEDGWVLVCASYTKTVAPDFRIGWLEAGRFRDLVHQLKFTTTVAESTILTETLGMFLENGSYDLHLRHLKRLYNSQIDSIRACIAKHFPEGTRVSRPQCGFILWLELPKGLDTLLLFHSALDEKILCMPGLLCSGNQSFNHCLRLAVCFEFDESHLDGIARLGKLACHL